MDAKEQLYVHDKVVKKIYFWCIVVSLLSFDSNSFWRLCVLFVFGRTKWISIHWLFIFKMHFCLFSLLGLKLSWKTKICDAIGIMEILVVCITIYKDSSTKATVWQLHVGFMWHRTQKFYLVFSTIAPYRLLFSCQVPRLSIADNMDFRKQIQTMSWNIYMPYQIITSMCKH
jgi:hypothetical protein